MSRSREFERHLSDYVISKGVRYQDVADELGLSYSAFYKKRVGTMPFTFAEGRKLAEMFGMTMEALYLIVPKQSTDSEA